MAKKAYNLNGDYIPRGDEPFVNWANNFARGVSEDPQRFHLWRM